MTNRYTKKPITQQGNNFLHTDQIHPFEQLKFLREETRFQHMVINFRVSWYVGTQAILLSSFTIAKANPSSNNFYLYWGVLIPIFAIFLSALIWPAIDAAWSRILVHRDRIDKLQQELLFAPHDPNRSSQALLYARLLPIAFSLFWIAIALLSVSKY